DVLRMAAERPDELAAGRVPEPDHALAPHVVHGFPGGVSVAGGQHPPVRAVPQGVDGLGAAGERPFQASAGDVPDLDLTALSAGSHSPARALVAMTFPVLSAGSQSPAPGLVIQAESRVLAPAEEPQLPPARRVPEA